MRRVLVAGVLAALSGLVLGCNRSDLLDETQCAEDGRYVVVQNNAFCVYPDEDTFFPCPDALPFSVKFAGAGFCAIEEAPPQALLGAALEVALDIDAGPPDAGDLPDGGILPDGSADAAEPVDAAEQP